MSNDLDLYQSGQVAPWEPSQPLAPSPADTWGQTDDIDYLREHSLSPSSHGLPANVEQNLLQVVGIFYSDLSSLGHPASHIEAAANWFKKTLANPPTSMQVKHHGYPSEWQYSADPIWRAFANHMWTLGATPQFMECCAYWCGELEKRLDAMQNNGGAYQGSPPATDGTFNSNGQLDVDNLSDAAYERLVAINETAKSRTTASLQRRWGQAYLQNLAAAQEVLKNLPASHQAYLSQYNPQTYVSGLNEEKTILGLFDMAVGGSLPSGAGIQREIDEILQIMRSNRKAYNGSPRLQARLRTLYDLRG